MIRHSHSYRSLESERVARNPNERSGRSALRAPEHWRAQLIQYRADYYAWLMQGSPRYAISKGRVYKGGRPSGNGGVGAGTGGASAKGDGE